MLKATLTMPRFSLLFGLAVLELVVTAATVLGR
ncbi:MAG: hypothetical protein JWM33_756 [Caulobacteraceae bacterium]|nr:hypothetical protein [Caulobacteraceae bacterium]